MTQNVIGNLPTGQLGKLPIDVHTANLAQKGTMSVIGVPSKLDDAAVGERLRLLRITLGLKKMEMADANEIDRTNFGRFEKGERHLPIEIGYRLSRRYGITLDWLYGGNWSSLSVEMAERLRQNG